MRGGRLLRPPVLKNGLEFMGRTWDRLDAEGIGQSTAGFAPGMPAVPGVRGAIKALPSYNARGNVRCRACSKWKWGHTPGDGGGGGQRCTCSAPDFPNANGVQNEAQQRWHAKWLAEVYRVLIPGGVVLAFGGSRTHHRLAAAMDDAGFMDVHLEAWTYLNGFPKNLNVGWGLDQMLGVERHVVGTKVVRRKGVAAAEMRSDKGAGSHAGPPREVPVTLPTSPEAITWQKWGTALKPAWEPVVVGRKPQCRSRHFA